MGQHYAFFAHFCAQNRAFPAIFDVPSNRLIPTFDAKCRLVSWVKLLIFSIKHCVVSKVHANQVGQKWDSNVTVPLPFKKTLTSHTK